MVTMGEIAKNLRIPKATMQKAIQRGTVEDCPGRGRKCTARMPENIRKIKKSLKKSLKKAIKKAWDEMPDDMVKRVVDSWSGRLQACIDAEGGYIE